MEAEIWPPSGHDVQYESTHNVYYVKLNIMRGDLLGRSPVVCVCQITLEPPAPSRQLRNAPSSVLHVFPVFRVHKLPVLRPRVSACGFTCTLFDRASSHRNHP